MTLAPRTAPLLALTLALAACDVDAPALDDAPVTFRDGWGNGGKLNTNFLGLDQTLPVDAVPLVDDPNGAVRLHAVWTKKCRDAGSGGVLNGLFYTSDLDGDLSVQIVDGALQPAVFRALGNPGVTCIVDGGAWDGTIWGIIVTENGVTYNRYMMLLSHGFDEHNVPIYRWGFFDEGDDIWSKAAYKPTCVEDKDPYANAFVYRYHAYLVEDLHVAADGTFSEAPSTFFLACRSGAVGKAIHWGYNPAKWGMELHELATRVVRADYCGTGVSFTQAGNAVQLHDKLTPQVNEFSKVTLTDEAAWDLDLSRATCVTLPRDHALRNGFQGIDCGGPDLVPFCTGDDMDDATIATKVAD